VEFLSHSIWKCLALVDTAKKVLKWCTNLASCQQNTRIPLTH
jgi:hypothetical protein